MLPPLPLAPTLLAGVLATVLLGGFVKGVAGFGYGIAGTAVLAAFLDPSSAVVIMIIPILAASLSLVGEVDASDLRPCVERFWLYISAALVGTAAGTFALGAVPLSPLKLGIGVVAVAYAALKTDAFEVPGRGAFEDLCFGEGAPQKAGLGLMSGAVFGATNVGIQVVAYLDSLDLDRSTFVGVLSMVLVGISGARVALAWFLGLYGSSGLVGVSAAAAVPGLAGVYLGSSARRRLPDSVCERAAVVLFAVVGVRLVLAGAGVA